jgi:pyruvate/2-oxoacid:ferredoxin oxidoreductase alpha subunit
VQDGYFVSHIPGKVSIPDQAAVDEYLPPYNCPHALNPQNPTNHGPQIFPDQGPAIDLQRAQAFLNTPKVIEKAVADYNKQFGRKYSAFLEEYKTDGADYVFFLQGGHCRTARFAVDHLRKQGAKVGMVKLRFVRPWPTEKIVEVLSKFKAVGVIESSTSYGGAMKGGKLQHEVRASLYDSPKQPAVTSFMAGLGGEVITLDEFYNMAKILDTAAKKGKVDQYVYWVGFDNGI